MRVHKKERDNWVSYYFPIDKIKKDSSIAVYGRGTVGKSLVDWNLHYKWCNICWIIDKQANDVNKSYKGIPIISVEDFKINMNVDYILLGSKEHEESMLADLEIIKYDNKKIIKLDSSLVSNEVGGTSDESATDLGEANYWGEDGLNWYNKAEKFSWDTFKSTLEPIVNKYHLFEKKSIWLDFGCGEGRIANILKEHVLHIYCCDISERAISNCKKRFKHCENVTCFVNGSDNISIDSNKIDIVFSIGTMVHFDLREMNQYLGEMSRILKDGGMCIVHHSNWRETEDYFISKGTHSKGYYRGDVSAKDVRLLARKNGFEIIEQRKIPWGDVQENIDCISVLKK
ncbi:MAG: class I SAM-dependent methyltransferase [Lachnospiraceae bacterium]